MKTSLAILTLLFAATAATAQVTADIEVSYTEHHPNFRNGKADLTSQYILLANVTESKFYSPMTEYLDSLQSTPEGDAKYKEMTRSAFMGGKEDQIPRRDGRYYVFKSTGSSTVRTYDVNGLDKYVIEEPMPQWVWNISDSTRTILGYECLMATTTFNGRVWTAWFTPKVPIMNGPWKLGGLPGLILEANEPSGLYSFVATGIQHTSREIVPIYSVESYDKIDRKEFLKAKRRMTDNPVSQMNAQLSGLGISISAASNSIQNKSREEIDFIETDY